MLFFKPGQIEQRPTTQLRQLTALKPGRQRHSTSSSSAAASDPEQRIFRAPLTATSFSQCSAATTHPGSTLFIQICRGNFNEQQPPRSGTTTGSDPLLEQIIRRQSMAHQRQQNPISS
ncbi:hypothetical protein ACLOJK_013687 [Asimina triloba]